MSIFGSLIHCRCCTKPFGFIISLSPFFIEEFQNISLELSLRALIIFDHYFNSINYVGNSKLYGIAALWCSLKYTRKHGENLNINRCIIICKNKYSASSIIKTILKILKIMKFNMSFATPVEYGINPDIWYYALSLVYLAYGNTELTMQNISNFCVEIKLIIYSGEKTIDRDMIIDFIGKLGNIKDLPFNENDKKTELAKYTYIIRKLKEIYVI